MISPSRVRERWPTIKVNHLEYFILAWSRPDWPERRRLFVGHDTYHSGCSMVAPQCMLRLTCRETRRIRTLLAAG
jgi:hypothetical protein